MKIVKQIKVLILTSMILFSAMLLWACGDGSDQSAAPSDSTEDLFGEATYTVKVIDALGNPYPSGIIARFVQNGEQVAMQVVNEQGVAEKVLAKGDYTVELMYTSSEASYYYDATDLTLTAERTELEIILSYQQGEVTDTLFATSQVTGEDREYDAYRVKVGSTYVELESGERNYFLFVPAVAGTYEFSTMGGSTAIGYYGAPHFVQGQHAAEDPVVDNKFIISVSASMINTDGTGTTVLVIGVDALEGTSNCILNVERIGDPIPTLEDEPWSVYQATATLAPYKLPEGALVQEFDLTASADTYKLVYNENDGYYHLNDADGPLVLVRLGEDNKYLSCFKTILDYSPVNKYFFDENGGFVKKESYSECLLEYFGYMDEDNGLYPLTEDLKYIIQQRGGYVGWFDSEESLYLFKDSAGNPIEGINEEISWLFMCCYIAE